MKNIFFIFCFIPILFHSCKKDETAIKFAKLEINGVVQKGPFLNGSSIGIFELNEDYSPTGKIFSSQIMDNSGAFKLTDVSLISQYVQLKADGYYYNEITGQNSNSILSLYSLSDIADKNTINVNILSTLEKSRIEYLISTGLSYSVSKKEAEKEVLKIFSITKSDVADFDMLNISADGDDNAILLAISIIMQGNRSESELSDLLANINTDIRQDGVLNSETLGSLLINDAKWINLSQIRNNIEKRYSSLSLNVTIPNFEKFINQFIDSSEYILTNVIKYPLMTNNLQNALSDSAVNFYNKVPYCISAFLPIGTKIKVLIKSSAGFSLRNTNSWNEITSTWDNSYDYGDDSLVYKSVGHGEMVYREIISHAPTSLVFEIYENNLDIPTRTKTILIN